MFNMTLLEEILVKILLTENVSNDDIDDAIDNHKRVIINYHSNGEDKNTGARVIEVYAYGLTKSGNPVIRAFEPYGDTTTYTPEWKFFRLDRISAWKITDQIFTEPANMRYKNLGPFNKDFDKTMSVVYKIATFDDDTTDTSNTPQSGPKSKSDVYKTPTERGLERLKQQVDNSIRLSDIKTGDAFKQLNQTQQTKTSGPKSKSDVYKTPTERGLENLRKQLENPRKIDLSQFDKPKQPQQSQKNDKTKMDKKNELDKLRKVLDKPMTLSDLNKRMNEPDVQQDNSYVEPTDRKENTFKTPTERGLENLRKQLENPRKIDLDKIPKK